MKYLFWEKAIKIHQEFDRRTVHKDWIKLINFLASKINSINKEEISILDIGCGDGTTAIQLLDLINKEKIIYDCVEASKIALSLFEKTMSKKENKVHLRNKFNEKYYPQHIKNKYDIILFVHTNYYITDNEENYKDILKETYDLINERGFLFIITLPSTSAFYKIVDFKIFSDFVYAEETEKILNNLKFNNKSSRFLIRIKIEDIFENDEKLLNFYRFVVNDVDAKFDDKKILLDKLKKISINSEGKFLDFNDWVIEVKK